MPKAKPKSKAAPAAKRAPGASGKPRRGPRFSLASIDRALLAILVLSTLLRLWGIGDRLPDASLGINVVDDTAIEETDRTTVMRSWAMWQGGMKEFDLNPHTGGWPALSFYLTLAIQIFYKAWYGFLHSGVTTAEFAKHVQLDSAGLFLLARIVNATIGILSVALTWRLALPLVGRTGAILAAAFLATNPLHILTSQHISDPNLLALVFVALAAAAMVKVADEGRTRDSVLAGIWIGLAAACKYVPLVLLAPLALAHLRGGRWNWRPFALAAGLAFVAMFAASPYTFLDWKTTMDAFGVQRRSLFSDWVGQSTFPISLPTYLIASLPKALGWPVYLLSIAGFAGLWRKGGGARSVALVAIVVVLANGLLRAAQERYLLVAYPMFVLAAAAGLLWLIDLARARLPETARSPRTIVFVAALAALAPIRDLIEIRQALRQPDSRHEARRWVNAHVGPTKRLAVELYGPVFSDRERNIVIWPFFATQAPLVAPAYHAEFLDGVETIVLSGEVSRRFEADSLKYPDEAAYYRWLREHGETIWRSNAEGRKLSGPIIEVRALPGGLSTRAERDSLFARLQPKPSGTYRLALWCHDMSLLFSRSGDFQRSEEWALRGLEVGAAKLSPRLYAALALSRLNLADFAGAEEAARLGIADAPRAYALHLYRGLALQRLGRLEESLPELRDALTLSGDARVHLNIAQALAALGRYEEAVAELGRVPRDTPERAAAMRDQAVILLNQLGRRDEGIAALKEAAVLTTDPNEAKLLADEAIRLQKSVGR
ncbi:MAG TPA: glycosyltransferase family 39 protein [Candidatus Eisenbacteria bacterium]|nr:glycosyltransferase family 39 protein [Candidatus Eisenbacteria bacterium]